MVVRNDGSVIPGDYVYIMSRVLNKDNFNSFVYKMKKINTAVIVLQRNRGYSTYDGDPIVRNGEFLR